MICFRAFRIQLMKVHGADALLVLKLITYSESAWSFLSVYIFIFWFTFVHYENKYSAMKAPLCSGVTRPVATRWRCPGSRRWRHSFLASNFLDKCYQDLKFLPDVLHVNT